MSTHPALAAFEAAERSLFDRHGLEARTRDLRLARPAMSCRVTEIGRGRPTLFVHGGGGCGALFAPLVASLPGTRALLLNRPGFGGTELRSLRGLNVRQDVVEFMTSVLDALELERVDIVANSMGGLWSLWLERAAPSRVRSLTLLGAPAFVGGGSAPLPMRLLGLPGIGALMMKLEPPSPKQVETLWGRMGHRASELSPEVHLLTEAMQHLPDYATAWRDLLGNMTSLGGPRPAVTFSNEELAEVSCPLTYVWGTNDPFGDVALGRAAAAQTAHAAFHVAGRGHLPWLDAPEACARHVGAILGAELSAARAEGRLAS